MWEADLGSINVKLFRSFHVTTLPNSFEKSQFSVGMIIDNRVLFTGDTRQSTMDIHPWTGVNTFLALETVTADIQRTGLRQTDV